MQTGGDLGDNAGDLYGEEVQSFVSDASEALLGQHFASKGDELFGRNRFVDEPQEAVFDACFDPHIREKSFGIGAVVANDLDLSFDADLLTEPNLPIIINLEPLAENVIADLQIGVEGWNGLIQKAGASLQMLGLCRNLQVSP